MLRRWKYPKNYLDMCKYFSFINLHGQTIILDSFCAAIKIIPDRASVHTKERLWWRDFCDGARLRRADL